MSERRYYAKDNPEFARLVREHPAFRPRFHFLYSEREAEQDAHFWFLQGQRVCMDEVTERLNRKAVSE